MQNFKVSICCICYNHSKFLRTAIDSVLSQKVNFPIEIIIGDDCSTDGSQEILKEYEINHKNIRVIYQPVNSHGKKNFEDVYSVANGEYIITLETDDFWIDEYKLQQQVDFLDSHPDCVAVAHQCIVVDKNNHPQKVEYPSIKEGTFTYKHFRRGLLPGQTTTLLYRNIKFDLTTDYSLYYKSIDGPGDSRKVFCLMSRGYIYTIPRKMSAYRYIKDSGNSFSATHKIDYLKTIKFFEAFCEYSNFLKISEMQFTADCKLIQTVMAAFKAKKIKGPVIFQYLKACKYPFRTLVISFLDILYNKLAK